MNYLEFANSILLTLGETPLRTMESNNPIVLKVKYAISETLSELATLGNWMWLHFRHTTELINWSAARYTLPLRIKSLTTVEYSFPNTTNSYLLTRVPVEQVYLKNTLNLDRDNFRYALEEDNILIVQPEPVVEVKTNFVITGYRVPQDFTADLQVIDIPDRYVNLLRAGCACKLALRILGDTSTANAHAYEWASQLQSLRNAELGIKSNLYRRQGGRKRGQQIN